MNGRRLSSAINSSTGVNNSYTYDADGLRLTKTVNGVQHRYVWQGSQLVSEYYSGIELEFFYDESGAPYAFSYKANASATPVMYYYVTNLQGDVTNIVDASGNVLASYSYNAWGKVLTATGAMAAINPIRYRGYYYDTDTELYYLLSRYYDPEICRFLNADSYASTGQGIFGTNMFAYCINNPVNYIDIPGTNAETIQLWATGMGWLPFVDTILPIGDIIYIGGILLLGTIALARGENNVPQISFSKVDVAYGSPPPNDDDDDDDDGYYDDDNNFGGREKMGKSKGKTPGNNQAQNKQFRDATKGLTQDQQRVVHDEITGKGLGFHDIKSVIKDLFAIVFGLFAFEE